MDLCSKPRDFWRLLFVNCNRHMTDSPGCRECLWACCNYYNKCPDIESPDPLVNECWTPLQSSNSPTSIDQWDLISVAQDTQLSEIDKEIE